MGYVSLPPPPPPPPPRAFASAPYAFGHPRAVTDAKAIVALGLGIASLVTVVTYVGGVALGVPAIVLGAMSAREVARSGGRLRGRASALAGLVTGGLGAALNVVYAVGLVVWLGHAPITSDVAVSEPGPTAPPATHAAPTSPSRVRKNFEAVPVVTPTQWGRVHVDDVRKDGGTLRAQLASRLKLATSSHAKLLVMTTASWSHDYQEIAIAMTETEMGAALDGVWIARIDVDEFGADLGALGMEADVPSFFLVGASLRSVDAIGTDEWDANDAPSIAPVLRDFVRGTLGRRVHVSGSATSL